MFRNAADFSIFSHRGSWAARCAWVLGGCCALALLAAPASAATLTWGTSGTGGTGTWTSANAWWNGTSQQTWSSAAPDDAVFAGTGGTVSVTTSATANSLTFNAFTGSYAITLSSGQTLGIGGGGIRMTAQGGGSPNGAITHSGGTVTISGGNGVSLTAAQSWINDSPTSLLVSNTVATNGNVLTIGGNSPIGFTAPTSFAGVTVSGPIIGTGGLTKSGAAVLSLTGANTYSGTTTIDGGQFILSGGGSINSTSAININGGNLQLINTAQADRLSNTAPITTTGGTLTLVNTSGANVYTETIGAVTLSRGQFDVVQATNQAGAGSQTLTLGGLTQSNRATVSFSAATTGPQASGNKNMVVVTGAGSTTAGQIIGPWATVGTAATAQTDYAVYNGNYVMPANLTATAENTWTTGQNAVLSGASTLTATRTLSSLRYTGGALTLALGANNLETNGILNGGSGLLTISAAGGAVRQQGTAAADLYVTTGNRGITISAPIVNNTGALTLVKAGNNGLLTLSGTNTYTGGTIINSGTLVASSTSSLPGYGSSGNVVFNGGSLQLPVGSGTWAMADVNALVGAATKNAGSLAIDTTAATQQQTASWNLGAVGLTKVGTNTLVLNQANTYTGRTTVAAGTLQLSNSAALGSSELNLAGGNVVLDTTVNLTTLTVDASGTASGGTMAFGSGGAIQVRNTASVTISSGITGSPAVLLPSAASATYTFAPTSGSQTIGKITNGYMLTTTGNPGAVVLAGVTTGNSVGSMVDTSYGQLFIRSGGWTLGNVNSRGITMTGGDVVLNGTLSNSTISPLPFAMNGGTLRLNNAGALNMNGNSWSISQSNTTSSIILDNSSGAAINTSTFNPAMGWTGGFTFLGSNGANSDLNLGTGAVTLAPNPLTAVYYPTVTVQNAATTLTVGGVISGGTSVGLGKAGPGTLKLSGANTFVGPTIVTSGTLLLSNTLALQNSPLVTTGAGVVRLDTGITTPVFGGLSGTSGSLGTIISGYSGVTRLTLNPQSGATVTYGVGIADGAAGMNLVKTGAGTQILSGANTYTGTTTVSAGTLVVSSSSGLPGFGSSGRVVFNGGTLQVPVDGTAWTMSQVDSLLTNATKTSGIFGIDIASGTQTQAASAWTGVLGLTKVGNGTLELNQANTFSGTTTVTAGTLLLNGASGAIASSGSVAVGVAGGPAVVLTLDSSSANNANRIGSVPVTLSNARLNLVGNASAATAETVGLLSAATGDSVVSISGGAAGQVAQLISTSGTIARSAGATLSILADGSTQTFNFTGGSPGINKGVFYGSSAATANEFAYYPGSGGAVTAPVYGTTTGFAAATNSALTASQHNKLSGSIASQAAVTINSLNMPSNYSLTALTGNLTFDNAFDQGAIIKSGGGAAQIGTAGNLFDIVGQAGGELVVNTVDAADNLTLNVGFTASTAGLTKTGAGTLTLTANRDYLSTGTTTVNAGTLVVNALNTGGVNSTAGGFKSASIIVNNGGTVRLGASDKIVYTGSMTVNAGGTLDLNGFSNTLSSLSGSGSVVNNTGTWSVLTLRGSGTNVFSGVISGSTGLTLRTAVSSNATYVLANQNTYTGTTNFGPSANDYPNNGSVTLRLGIDDAIRSGNDLYMGSANGQANAIVDLAGFNQTLRNIWIGGGGFPNGNGVITNSIGTSTLTVTGTVTYVDNQAPTAVISVTNLDLNGGTRTFDVVADNSLTSPVATELTVSSVIRNGGLTKTNTGVLALTGANVYTGTTTISAGTLQLGAGGTTGSISSSSPVSVASGAAIAFNRSDALIYGGTISGAGNLTKAGAGKLTFTAAQLYAGNTVISGGTLALGSAGSFANSSAIVVGDAGSSGAVLDLTAKTNLTIGSAQTLMGKGTALLGPSTALTVAGTFSPGNSPGLFTYDGGSTTLAGTTLMEIFGTSRGVTGGYDGVDIVNGGLLTLGGSLILDFNQTFATDDTFLLFQGLSGGSLAGTFGSYSILGSSDYTGLMFSQVGTSNVWRTGTTGAGQWLELSYGSSAVTLTVASVPEPGTLALAGVGLGFIGWKTWRRRNRRKS